MVIKKQSTKKSNTKTSVKKSASSKSESKNKTKKSASTTVKKSAKQAVKSNSKDSSKTKKTNKDSMVAKSDSVKIPASAKYLKDKKWLEKQREILIENRKEYTDSAEKLAADAAALMADREPGDVQFDEESGEGDTIAVERDRDLALSAQARQAVEDIDAALERMDKGVYGLCVVAQDPIPKARLEYIPEASVCVEHKTSMFI